MKSAIVPVLSVLTLGSSLVGGCIGDPESTGDQTEETTTPEEPASSANLIHVTLTEQAQAQADKENMLRASPKTLTYYGGPVVQNVDVHPVYWNSKVEYQSNLNSFYGALVTGAEMTFLGQYDTTSPKQTIGAGTSHAGYVDSQTGTSLTDAQVQSYLVAAFNSGKLPKPTANTYYPVHFPAGVSIALDSSDKSCVQFCAYHGTGTYNGAYFYYGVLPDLGQSGCNSGCGTSTVLNNSTSVASHEFAETVTDAAVGVATNLAPPLGWYNNTYGEIGDICNGEQTTAVLGDGKSYTIQKLWSNSSKACVTP